MSLFHHLPAEIVREVLDILDPASFYLCLQTSKLFRQHASASTKLLRDQLARIPGQRIISPHIASDANALMREFSKRAAQHLVDGVPWMADQQVFCADPRADRKNSYLTRWGDEHFMDNLSFRGRLVLLEVLSRDATVNIHVVEDDGNGNRPRLKHIISPHGLAEHLPGCSHHGTQYVVVKVAPCLPNVDHESMVAVLYRALSPCQCRKLWMRLLVFRLDATFGPMVIDSFEIEDQKDEVVVALAMTRSTEAIIVVRHYNLEIQRVMVYRIVEDEATLERRTTQEYRMVIPTLQFPLERVSSISVHDRTIHLYPSTFPIPHWTISALSTLPSDIGEAVERRDTLLPDVVDVFPKHSLGKAIHQFHHHEITDPDLNDGEATCVNTALELMISREESVTGSRTGAFLLKALHYPTSCKPFDITEDYQTLHHVFVAQLSGLPDLHNLSTLGLRLAVSPGAYRIAIASWKTVKVWSLDPMAFLSPEYSLAGAQGVPGDYAFIEGCAWQFYSSGKFRRECVVLEPVELPSLGVVFDLAFRSEDELWGWTEPGLCRWRFGVGAQGRHDVSLLEGAE